MGNTINAEMILYFIREKGLTKSSFCKLCNIGVKTLNKILANKDNFRVIALFKIARVMKKEVYQLFK